VVGLLLPAGPAGGLPPAAGAAVPLALGGFGTAGGALTELPDPAGFTGPTGPFPVVELEEEGAVGLPPPTAAGGVAAVDDGGCGLPPGAVTAAPLGAFAPTGEAVPTSSFPPPVADGTVVDPALLPWH